MPDRRTSDPNRLNFDVLERSSTSEWIRRANLAFVSERASQLNAARFLVKTLQQSDYRLIWVNALVPNLMDELERAGISATLNSHEIRRVMARFQQILPRFDEDEAVQISVNALKTNRLNPQLAKKPALYARAYSLLVRMLERELVPNGGVALLVNQATDFRPRLHRIHLCGQSQPSDCCERSDWRVPLQWNAFFFSTHHIGDCRGRAVS